MKSGHPNGANQGNAPPGFTLDEERKRLGYANPERTVHGVNTGIRLAPDRCRGLTGGDMENWTWGLSLIALTIIIHATGIASMAILARRIRDGLQSEGARWHALTITIGLIGAVGLLLAVLHGIEAGIWATVCWWLGALRSPGEALLYSVDSITTRGASGLMLDRSWRMMGALEAADGMLLFGISTAFIFGLMQLYAPLIYREPPSH